MWLQVEGFMEMVKQWWPSYTVVGTPDFILTLEVKEAEEGYYNLEQGDLWQNGSKEKQCS